METDIGTILWAHVAWERPPVFAYV